jgi:hypothetical protein
VKYLVGVKEKMGVGIVPCLHSRNRDFKLESTDSVTVTSRARFFINSVLQHYLLEGRELPSYEEALNKAEFENSSDLKWYVVEV